MGNVEKCKIDIKYINNSESRNVEQVGKQTIIKTEEFYCGYDLISESFQVWVRLHESGKEGFLYGFLESPMSSYSSKDAEALQVQADIWECEVTEEAKTQYTISYDKGYHIVADDENNTYVFDKYGILITSEFIEEDEGENEQYENNERLGKIVLSNLDVITLCNGNQFLIEHKRCYTDDEFYTMANGELIRRGIKAN